MCPISNRDIKAAHDYHTATKHSYWSIRLGSHFLDWEQKPLLFKLYPTLPAIPLPRDITPPAAEALDTISTFQPAGTSALDLTGLAQVLFFCAGLTKKKVYPGGEEHDFRAASCTGALYEVEIYAVCGDLPGLSAGVYHFCPADFALRRLRAGDLRGELTRATAGEKTITSAPVILVLTAIFWRNAWKYQARAYRHFYWNGGTILANLLATAVSAQLTSRVVTGFMDARVDHLLGLDNEREASLCLVPIGAHSPAVEPPEILPIAPETVPLSKRETDYPLITQIRAASMLLNEEEVQAWRSAFAPRPSPPLGDQYFPLYPIEREQRPIRTLGEAILRRGSTRQFAQLPISFQQLSTILERSSRGIPADFLGGPSTTLLDIYLIVNSVENLPTGAFYFSSSQQALELLKEGTFRREAGYLCLEQGLGIEASVVVFFLADLERIIERYGNRGYGAAQLEAGIVGGKMYLCAYALGLGATGTTFYDDDVTQFFSPHAAGKATLFALALGHSARVHGRITRLRPGAD
ncbi:SagB/ThcOx family dehydrogenase [Candidatus Methylomirabilis sp.]|uniref:SagB/ThcOx family dehydrogenase n=1 Tax=Candidatus Methylomirabilis sp. TaxID=2032687 RepID=UPI002A69049E|nr:SagB/ThcOx family dehydrogenase [Candidatus Methylomirabilis sp.]